MSDAPDLVDGGTFTQAFGCTDYSFEWSRSDCAGGHFHAGIDVGAPHRANVRTTRAGTVVQVGIQYLGDQAVCVQADEGVFLEFGHLDQAAVGVGNRVAAGQLIGYCDSKGASTGDHVHLEVRTDGPNQGPPWGAVIDPTPYLINAQGADDMSKEAEDQIAQIHGAVARWEQNGVPISGDLKTQIDDLFKQIGAWAASGVPIPGDIVAKIDAIKSKLGA